MTARLKEIKRDKEAKDEAVVLQQWLTAECRGDRSQAAAEGGRGRSRCSGHARYPELTEAEVKVLVVDDKWLAALDTTVHSEMDRVSQQITQRVRDLAERYENSLPLMQSRLAELEAKVSHHLATMGFSWA